MGTAASSLVPVLPPHLLSHTQPQSPRVHMSSQNSDTFDFDACDDQAPTSSSSDPQQAETQAPVPSAEALKRYERLKRYETENIQHFEGLANAVKELKSLKDEYNYGHGWHVRPRVQRAEALLNNANETLQKNITDNDNDFVAMLSQNEQQERLNKRNLANMQKRLRDRKANVEKWIEQFKQVRPECKDDSYPSINSALKPLDLDSIDDELKSYVADSKLKVTWAERGIGRLRVGDSNA